MRIMHIISGGDVGGAKTHVLSLLKGLSARHEVTLVCFLDGDFVREARERGIHTVVYPGSKLLHACKELKKIIRKEKYDIVHCHGAKGNAMGLLLKGRVDIPVITTVHSDPKLDYMGRFLGNLVYGNINRFAMRRMDYWVAVSDATKQLLVERGFDSSRIFPIYNGVEFTDLGEIADRETFIKQLGLDWDEQQVIFGIAARISPVKDLATLITAFSQVAKKVPNVKLLIAGDGEDRAKMEELAAEICPKGSYHFAGWLKETNSFYHALDVNMLTSVTEAFPYAIPEGARMHCATIATRVGGVPQMVIDGETGFLIHPGDVDTLTDRMVKVAVDKALRERLGQAIYEKVRREFSAETTVQRQEHIYDMVLRRYHHPDEKRGVLICGAYGNGNMGDETILKAILQRLRLHDPDMPICVMSRRPKLTAANNCVSSVFTFNPVKTKRIMKHTKLFISGGGSLIQDATSTRSLLFYLHSLRSAHRNHCKVMMYGCGIGPVGKKGNREKAGEFINAYVDVIALRDPESQQELENLGVNKPEIYVTADPAITQAALDSGEKTYEDYRQSAGMKPDEAYCMFALRPWGAAWKMVKEFARAAEYVYEKHGLIPALFMLEPGKDQQITQAVAEQIRCPHIVLPPAKDGATICAIIRDMRLVVSMRLHALIFAAGQGTPAVGISYDPKVQSFMDYMGQKHCISLDDVTENILEKSIDGALSGEEDQGQMLERLRTLAAQNDELAWKLLNDEK